jgi:hypothetical protein
MADNDKLMRGSGVGAANREDSELDPAYGETRRGQRALEQSEGWIMRYVECLSRDLDVMARCER